jgi:hypothetical protein
MHSNTLLGDNHTEHIIFKKKNCVKWYPQNTESELIFCGLGKSNTYCETL